VLEVQEVLAVARARLGVGDGLVAEPVQVVVVVKVVGLLERTRYAKRRICVDQFTHNILILVNSRYTSQDNIHPEKYNLK